MSNSADEAPPGSIVFTTINSVSFLVCLLAALSVFILRLYNRLLYRLALYQVLSAMTFTIVDVAQIFFLGYGENPADYRRLCIAIGWFNQYLRLNKLLFTMWIAFHVFCFAVLNRNFKKLEALYVATSLVIPATIAIVPLATGTYNLAPSIKYCYISGEQNVTRSSVVIVEKLIFWDVPVIVILCIASATMVAVVIKLARRVRWKPARDSVRKGDQFGTAVKQLLPLVAFPLLMSVFAIPAVLVDIYSISRHSSTPAMFYSQSAFSSACNLASGLTLVLHIAVARVCDGQKRHTVFGAKQKMHLHFCSVDKQTVAEETGSLVYLTRSTSYSPPALSLSDESERS